MRFYVRPQATSSSPDVLLGKGVMKLCNKFTEEHPCKVGFQFSCFETSLKLHLGMGFHL